MNILKRLKYWQREFRVLSPGAQKELNDIVRELEVQPKKKAKKKSKKKKK